MEYYSWLLIFILIIITATIIGPMFSKTIEGFDLIVPEDGKPLSFDETQFNTMVGGYTTETKSLNIIDAEIEKLNEELTSATTSASLAEKELGSINVKIPAASSSEKSAAENAKNTANAKVAESQRVLDQKQDERNKTKQNVDFLLKELNRFPTRDTSQGGPGPGGIQMGQGRPESDKISSAVGTDKSAESYSPNSDLGNYDYFGSGQGQGQGQGQKKEQEVKMGSIYYGQDGSTAIITRTNNDKNSIYITYVNSPAITFIKNENGVYVDNKENVAVILKVDREFTIRVMNKQSGKTVIYTSSTNPNGNGGNCGNWGAFVSGANVNNTVATSNTTGIAKSDIPAGREDAYILKSQIPELVCPACPPPLIEIINECNKGKGIVATNTNNAEMATAATTVTAATGASPYDKYIS